LLDAVRFIETREAANLAASHRTVAVLAVSSPPARRRDEHAAPTHPSYRDDHAGFPVAGLILRRRGRGCGRLHIIASSIEP